MGESRRINAIVVPVTTDVSKFSKGLKDAKKDAERFGADASKSFLGLGNAVEATKKKLQELGHVNLGTVAKGLAGLATAAVAAAGAVGTIGFKHIKDVGKDALSLGLGAEALSRLRAVARATGTDLEDLSSFVKTLTEGINEGIGKTTPFTEALKSLGTSAEELAKLTPEDQIKRLNEGFAALGSDAERARVAMKLAGGDGVKVLRMLALGTDKFKDAFQNAPIVSEDDVSDARKLQIAIDKIAASVQSVADQFTTRVIPVVTWAAELLDQVAQKFSFLALKVPKLTFPAAPPVAAATAPARPTPTSPAPIPAPAATPKDVEEARKRVEDLQKLFEKQADLISKTRPQFVPSTNGGGYRLQANQREMRAKHLQTGQDLNAAKQKAAQLGDAAKTQSQAMADAMRLNQGLAKQVADLKQEYRSTIETSGQDEIHRRVGGIKGLSTPDRKALIRQGYQAREANKTSALRDELQESTKLPVEKLQEDLARISKMAQLGPANGGLTKLQAIRAAAKKTAESGVAGGQMQFAGAVQANSVEGRSYLLSQMMGQPQDAIEVARQGVAATMQGNSYLAKLVASVGRPDVQVSF